jgi:hypothetical protein
VPDLAVSPSGRLVASLFLEQTGGAPFEAELLVRSLIRNGGVAPGDIVIHCRPDLDPVLTAQFVRAGSTVNVLEDEERTISSGLLGQLTALNKLALHDVAATWLFCRGTAVTAMLPTPSHISGKLCGATTLSSELVKRAFEAANIAVPPWAPCDESCEHVVATHLDVSLLFIPYALIPELCAAWGSFASFVVAIPEVAAGPDADRRIEELSLALALAHLAAPIEYLPANDCFALDSGCWPHSYDARRPIRTVRYRHRLDQFGLVSSFLHDRNVDGAVDKLNALGSERSDGPHFALYTRARIRAQHPLPERTGLATAAGRWAHNRARLPRLVLHAGTPKTGTTAIQRAFFSNAEALIKHGIWYAPMLVEPVQKKHQFLVHCFTSGDASALAEAFDRIAACAPAETETIVLSAEGLFNGWWDYPPEGKALLRHLSTVFRLEMWTCFREPVDFAVSQYAQLLRNPRLHSPAYGLDIGLDEILDIDWFVQRLDYLGFVYEVEAIIGAGSIRLFRYGPDIVERIFRALGVEPPPGNVADVHASLRTPGVDILRIVNRYNLPTKPKAAAAALALELDRLVGEQAEPLQATPAAAERIRRMTQRGWREIAARLDR